MPILKPGSYTIHSRLRIKLDIEGPHDSLLEARRVAKFWLGSTGRPECGFYIRGPNGGEWGINQRYPIDPKTDRPNLPTRPKVYDAWGAF